MKVCSVCGTSLEEIAKTQNIGCAECYYTFEEEFSETLSKYGIKGEYTGSLPKRLKGYRSTLTTRVDIKLKLEEALQNEEYEKAALYRDYLKVLSPRSIQSGEEPEMDNQEEKE